MQHNPSPAAVGLAAYTSGLGKADERKRKEQQAQLQQMYGQRFQLGMNQLRYGQEKQLGQDRLLQQQEWQGARDEREFGQKQQLANAEARARGEPLPFPGLGQGNQQGAMQPGQLPKGPGTTLDPNYDPFAASGAAPSLVDPNAPTPPMQPGIGGAVAPPMQPGYDANGSYVGRTPGQQRQDLANQHAQAIADQKIRDGIDKGTHKLPEALAKEIAANDNARVQVELNPKWTEGDKVEERKKIEAERQRLDALKIRLARPVPKQTPTDTWNSGIVHVDPKTNMPVPEGTPGSRAVHIDPKTGKPTLLDLNPKTDPTTTMTAAQSAADKRATEKDAAKYTSDRGKEKDYLEDQFTKKEVGLRAKITKEESDRWEKGGRIYGKRPMTATEIENDSELQETIDKRMEAERKRLVDDRLKATYPERKAPDAAQPGPAEPPPVTEPQPAPPTLPTELPQQPNQVPATGSQPAPTGQPDYYQQPEVGGSPSISVPSLPTGMPDALIPALPDTLPYDPGAPSSTFAWDKPIGPIGGLKLPPEMPQGSQLLPDGTVRLPDGRIVQRKKK